MKKLILISALLFMITGCASNTSGDNSPEFKKVTTPIYEEYLYKQDPYQQAFGTSYILTVSRKGWRCGMGILDANTGWCATDKAKQGTLERVSSKICQQENHGDYIVFTTSQITTYFDAKFICFKDEKQYQAYNESKRRIREDREKKAKLANQEKIERQQAAKEAARLEVIAKENAILESKKEKCRSYGFEESTNGFGFCMLEQDRIAEQVKAEVEEQRKIELQKAYEQRKREAQALINAGSAILNRNKGNCNFSCPGGQVVQGSCSTSSINVNGKICFKR
jgi:hypothetical protein